MNLQLIPLFGKFLLTFIFTLSFSKAQDKDSVRVVSYNVWYGFTKKKERKIEWSEYVKSLNCDIIALQELNEYTPEKLSREAKSWGHSYSALLKEGGFPTGITSKFPLRNLKKEMAGYHHGMLSCEAAGIQIYVIHLHPGHWEIRHQEVDLLLNILKVYKSDKPVLLVGDFNTFSHRDEIYYNQTTDLIPFFRRLDLRWKSNRNLKNDTLDYFLNNLVKAISPKKNSLSFNAPSTKGFLTFGKNNFFINNLFGKVSFTYTSKFDFVSGYHVNTDDSDIISLSPNYFYENPGSIGGNILIDLALSYDIKNYKLRFSLNNITDKDGPRLVSTPPLRRNFQTEVVYSF